MRMVNWGVILRWKMALNEIRLYHAIPEPTITTYLISFDLVVAAYYFYYFVSSYFASSYIASSCYLITLIL